MHPDDATLVAALLQKNEAAFVGLVARVQPKMRRAARRIVDDDQAADDVVQESWRRVLKHLPRFTGDSRLDTWIVQIAINRARTRRAQQQRETLSSSLPQADERDPLDGAFTVIGSWRVSPQAADRRASDRELAGLVVSALARLPERERLAVSLRDVDGLDNAEAATALGVSDANLRVILHRGRTRLRQLVLEQTGSVDL
ncbi:MAG TPA: sigma-70 family RNA polymerase sigma factor [Myxococcota bacterium]